MGSHDAPGLKQRQRQHDPLWRALRYMVSTAPRFDFIAVLHEEPLVSALYRIEQLLSKPDAIIGL